MKRVFKILTILIIFVLGMYSINAETKLECTYSLVGTGHGTFQDKDIEVEDTITFYFSSETGLSRYYKMGNGARGKMTNCYMYPCFSIGGYDAEEEKPVKFGTGNKTLSVYQPDLFDISFPKETTKTCPSSLSYIVLSTADYGSPGYDYILLNPNYNPQEACNVQLHPRNLQLVKESSGSSSKSSSKSSYGGGQGGSGSGSGGSSGGSQGTGKSSQGTGKSSSSSVDPNKKKLCGDPVVISINGRGLASDNWAESLLVQYYLENGEKWIQISVTRGENWESYGMSQKLNQGAGNVTDTDYFKVRHGGVPLRIETFDDCDKVDKVISCLYDATNGYGLYIGTKCNEDVGGDPDTEQPGQPVSSYHSAYKSNFPSSNNSFKIPDIGGGTGFGSKANCKKVFGDAGYKIINGLIRIVRILAPIVAILVSMITLIPAVTAKDEVKVKEATKKCVTIGIVLLVIEVMPYIVRLIGVILDFDLSCIG